VPCEIKKTTTHGSDGQGGAHTVKNSMMVQVGMAQDDSGQEIRVRQVGQENKKKDVLPPVPEKESGANLSTSEPRQGMSDGQGHFLSGTQQIQQTFAFLLPAPVIPGEQGS
jgi:hypothetical protein